MVTIVKEWHASDAALEQHEDECVWKVAIQLVSEVNCVRVEAGNHKSIASAGTQTPYC